MRPAARARQVVLQGEDESLRSLLSDVLEDMGLMLSASGEGRGWPDVVLVLVQRGDSLFRVLQQALHEKHGLQCVFCTPGIVLTMQAWLAENPAPSEADIAATLIELNSQQTAYQAALKVGANILQSSLLDFLR